MANRWVQAVVVSSLVLGFPGAPAAASPGIALVVYDQAGIDGPTMSRARSQIARIFANAGIDVAWVDPGGSDLAGAFSIQVLLRRHAVTGSGSTMGIAIGDVHETGGSALVFYDRVLRSAHESRQDVAQVLAYAMAHEMGHLLLTYPSHSTSGIMRPLWDGDDLRRIAGGSLPFTAAQATVMRAKVSSCCS